MGCAISGLALGWLWSPQPTQLTFLSVGQGDCGVFQTAGVSVVIDTGPKTPVFDAGKKIVLPNLEKLGVQSVDLILLSHPDEDHVGGTGAILKAFPQARLVMSAQFKEHSDMARRIKEWGLKNEDVLWLGPQAHVRVGSFRLEIRDPVLEPGANDNDGSMFVHVTRGAASAVLSGDAGALTERSMEPLADWSSQVMKVGHHGSRTSTDPSWLSEVRPRYAVISCGRDNVYGHPSPRIVQRLEESGVKVFRTDQQGSITFRFDEKRGFLPE
ncbi:MAG: competence protein ComEC [Fimbriimonadaceae bacterium]|jgi:competence protein ComEC|nr:competence protein ComEC [Fimbriimonadaceae bacterium]